MGRRVPVGARGVGSAFLSVVIEFGLGLLLGALALFKTLQLGREPPVR